MKDKLDEIYEVLKTNSLNAISNYKNNRTDYNKGIMDNATESLQMVTSIIEREQIAEWMQKINLEEDLMTLR